MQYNQIIQRGARFINNNPDIIKHIWREVSYNDEPKLYSYASHFNSRFENFDDEAVASGVSFDKDRALAKMLGETIERYLLDLNDDSFSVYKSFKELSQEERLVLNPSEITAFLDAKYRSKSLGDLKIRWLEGESLTFNKKIMIPAQLVYVPYLYQEPEPIICSPISTGAAAGTSLEEALYRGICEVVERDAFMISYLNKLPCPQIDLSFATNKIKKITEYLKRYKLELTVLEISVDLQIPVFASLILDRTGVGPSVSVGLKAGFDEEDTIIGAIEESLMVRMGTRDRFSSSNSINKRKRMIHTVDDRAFFWFPVKRIKYLDFWLNTGKVKRMKTNNIGESKGNLKKLKGIFNEKKLDILYVDITNKNVERYNLKVVKVIIPKLQPLYLDEKYRCLGGRRLYEVPIRMGIFKKTKARRDLNKIPHPFL